MNDNELQKYEMNQTEHEELEFIKRSHINGYLFTNHNRAAIIYLLNNQDQKEMQTEKISYHLGISHRTALYHLEILEQCGFVEVRGYRRHGLVPTRSVWGINTTNLRHIEYALKKMNENIGKDKLELLSSKKIRYR